MDIYCLWHEAVRWCRSAVYLFCFRKETVSELLSHMLDGERIDSVIVNGLSVIQTLLEFKKTGCVRSQPPCYACVLRYCLTKPDVDSKLISFKSQRVNSILIILLALVAVNWIIVVDTVSHTSKFCTAGIVDAVWHSLTSCLGSPEGITEQLTMLDADRLTQGISSTLDALMPRLKDIHRILVDAPKVSCRVAGQRGKNLNVVGC